MRVRGLLALTTAAVSVATGVVNAGSAQATPRPAVPKPISCATCWHPAVRSSWTLELSQPPTAPYRHVAVYDVDGFDVSAATVAALHANGSKVVCYLSAGTYEDWRPDAASYPKAVLGNSNGWPGERWVDIRELQKAASTLRSIIDTRLRMCRSKGFDAADLDNMDAYTNASGFAVTAQDQLFFNETLANDAHRFGLSVLQKNDLEQIPVLRHYFDGAVNEQCNEYDECTTAQNGAYGLDQYVAAGKPVFQVEYNLAPANFCAADNANDFNGVLLSIHLDESIYHACR
jgi:hypothetical protein